MRICTFALGPLETNCYLLHSDTEAVAIDPGGDPATVLSYLEKRSLKLTHILNTHFHFDHVLGNAALSEATGAPIMASKADAYLLRGEFGSGGSFGLPPVPPFEYQPLEEGRVTLLGQSCSMLHTPGHTLGSLSFYWPSSSALFAGDVLFYRSIGRTDLPGGDSDTLRSSIQEKLFLLPPSTVVYPGHGPSTTIEDERRSNPYFGLFTG